MNNSKVGISIRNCMHCRYSSMVKINCFVILYPNNEMTISEHAIPITSR